MKNARRWILWSSLLLAAAVVLGVGRAAGAAQGAAVSPAANAATSAGLSGSIFQSPAAPEAACDPSMIAYWKFDEKQVKPYSSATFIDSQNSYDGTCSVTVDQYGREMGCPEPAAGKVGGGQHFDGYKTAINVPANTAFDWGKDASFSVEFWFNSGGDPKVCLDNSEVVIGRDDHNTSLQWWLGCDKIGQGGLGGGAAFYLKDKNGVSVKLTSQKKIVDGNWHHVVGVYDGTLDKVTLYVDGISDGSEKVEKSYTSTAGFDSPTAQINLGWFDNRLLIPSPTNPDPLPPHTFHFSGVADEVAVFGKALAASEVGQHYTSGQAGDGYCTIALEINSSPVLTAYLNTPYTYDVNVTSDQPATFELVSKPAGMSIDPSTGVISWVPNAIGAYNVTVEASNSVGNKDSQTFTITVQVSSLKLPLILRQ